MISFAKAQIQGNVGNVSIEEANNKPYARFSVAAQESWKKDDDTYEKRTHWINCVTFNPATVKYIQRNVPTGRTVWVSGDLKTSEYEKEGQKHTSVDLHIDAIEVGPKKEESSA